MHSGLMDAQSEGMYALPLLRNLVPDLLRVAQPWHIYRCVHSSPRQCNLMLNYNFFDVFGAECMWRTVLTTHFIRNQAPGRRCSKSLTGWFNRRTPNDDVHRDTKEAWITAPY
jgi:hypothetical protein